MNSKLLTKKQQQQQQQQATSQGPRESSEVTMNQLSIKCTLEFVIDPIKFT